MRMEGLAWDSCDSSCEEIKAQSHFYPYPSTSRVHVKEGKERTWRVAKYSVPYLEFVLCI